MNATQKLAKMADDHHSWGELAQQWVEFQAVRKAAGFYMSTFEGYVQDNHINAYNNLPIAVLRCINSHYADAALKSYNSSI